MDALTWKTELTDELRTFANPDELELLWLSGNSERISSFSEEVAHVFDDLDIDAFLALSPNDTGLSNAQQRYLLDFRNALSAYVDQLKSMKRPRPSDKEILEDLDFKRITALARRFVEEIERNR